VPILSCCKVWFSTRVMVHSMGLSNLVLPSSLVDGYADTRHLCLMKLSAMTAQYSLLRCWFMDPGWGPVSIFSFYKFAGLFY
jgi:hypothetical protein